MKLIHMMGLENGDTMRYMKNRCFTWILGVLMKPLPSPSAGERAENSHGFSECLEILMSIWIITILIPVEPMGKPASNGLV